jgi:hypothetical protein
VARTIMVNASKTVTINVPENITVKCVGRIRFNISKKKNG